MSQNFISKKYKINRKNKTHLIWTHLVCLFEMDTSCPTLLSLDTAWKRLQCSGKLWSPFQILWFPRAIWFGSVFSARAADLQSNDFVSWLRNTCATWFRDFNRFEDLIMQVFLMPYEIWMERNRWKWAGQSSLRVIWLLMSCLQTMGLLPTSFCKAEICLPSTTSRNEHFGHF